MMSNELPAQETADLLGVRINAWFFDPAQAQQQADVAGRLLPMMSGLPKPPQPLAADGQRPTYRIGLLQAQPELVLTHGNGLLCLAAKQLDGRSHTPGQWWQSLSVDTMLQALACAMAVAGQQQKPCAALWRGPNVVYQFDPGPQVLECLSMHIASARRYWNENGTVSPVQLASFCEPRLRALPGLAPAVTAVLTAAEPAALQPLSATADKR